MTKKKAFTLIELLVVISIIALLLSILMPSLKKARQKARDVVCKTNLRSIGLSLTIYTMDNDEYLPTGSLFNEERTNGFLYWSDVVCESGDLYRKQGDSFVPERPPRGTIECPSLKNISNYWGKYGYGWNFDYFGYRKKPGWSSGGIGWGMRATRVRDPKTLIIGDNFDTYSEPIWAAPTIVEPAKIDDKHKILRHNEGGHYLGLDTHVEHLTWDNIYNDRTADHYGTSSTWGNAYASKINRRFTPIRD